VRAAAGEGVELPVLLDDGDLDTIDWEDANEALVEVAHATDALEVSHESSLTAGGPDHRPIRRLLQHPGTFSTLEKVEGSFTL
jgi:hypothetical protein